MPQGQRSSSSKGRGETIDLCDPSDVEDTNTKKGLTHRDAADDRLSYSFKPPPSGDVLFV